MTFERGNFDPARLRKSSQYAHDMRPTGTYFPSATAAYWFHAGRLFNQMVELPRNAGTYTKDNPDDQNVRNRFKALAHQWKGEIQFSSSITEMVQHPLYWRIVAMGPDIIPYLLEDLEQEPTYWFQALRALTNDDPVPEHARGNLQAMTAAWLEWGRARGHI